MKKQIRTIGLIAGQHVFSAGVLALALMAGASKVAAADAIPYPDVGTPNPTTYTFTATTSGDIMAYFAGSSASYDNEVGLLVNGVSTGIVGLDDHTSYLGESLDLGHANAGDTLVFELVNYTLGMNAYSDPSMNVSYDNAGETLGHNHVYSTPYTATDPIIDGVPSGTYVGFEDLPFPGSDFNYFDENFVFTDVSVTPQGVPDSASSLSLLGMGLAGVGLLRRRLSR
jgi:hypothetical protein